MGHKKQSSSEKTNPALMSESVIYAKGTALPVPFTVGIGASAGGHEALEHIFTTLPSDCGLSYVVIMHLPADTPSLLADLLRRYTSMQVLTAEDGMPLRPDTVYVPPAGTDLVVSNGQLRFNTCQGEQPPHHPIDRFFASLAADLGQSAIAVVLSGFGTDGSEGVKRVKESGGIVLIQDPKTAINPFMPQNALATGAIDAVLPAQEMGCRLAQIVRGDILFLSQTSSGDTINEELKSLFTTLKTKTGHDFSSYKRNTILRRIERRMAVNGVRDFSGYLTILENNPQEAQALSREFLIGVTDFFRDPEAFEILRSKIIPALFANRKSEVPVRIWHACCATGEEAYSVAMLILEYLEKENLQAKVQIFATDLDKVAVARARAGLYAEDLVSQVGEKRLARFFTKSEGQWRITKQLREMIVFAQHNIIKDPPFSRLDLLVCRNFLIYLNPDIQKLLIPLFHQVLNPGAFLFLGSAETVGLHSDLFTPADALWKIFMKKEGQTRVDTLFPFSSPSRKIADIERSTRSTETEEQTTITIVDKLLRERYLPARIIINEKNEVVYFSNKAGLYLLTPEGKPTRDLLKIAREELRPALRAAIYKAFTDQKENEYRGVKVVIHGDEATVNIIVVPLSDLLPAGKLAVVIIEPASADTFATAPREYPDPEAASSGKALTRHLEDQLRITSEQLQSTSEQLETSNERFLLANEELMTVNEELQSTNEELQSTNEELVTVNSELQRKMEELNQSNSDLQNLFTSSEIATIILDQQLLIKRFSPAMAEIFNLLPTDINRPIQHLNSTIDFRNLALDASSVLDSRIAVEREVTSLTGNRSFIMRILPYLTTEGFVGGIVVTLIDITLRKRTEEALKASEQQLALFIDQAPASLAMFDTRMCYLRVSRRWLTDYGLGDRSLSGLCHYDVFPEISEEWREAHRRGLAGKEIQAEADRFERADGSVQWIRWKIQPWKDAAGKIGGIVIFTEDITDIKKAEETLRRYELLSQHSRDIILFIRYEDGRILEANAAAVQTYGYSYEEMLRMTLKDLRAPDTLQSTASQMLKAVTEGVLFESIHCRKDGTTFPVEVNSQGAVIGGTHMLLNVIRDITERKHGEDALRETRANMEAALASMADAVFIADTTGNIIVINEAFAKFHRFENKQACSLKRADYIDLLEFFNDSRELVPRESWPASRALRGETVTNAEYTLRRKDTGETWVGSFSFSPIRDKQGAFFGAVVVGRDITEIKKKEEALNLSEQRRSMALEAAKAGTWEWDLQTDENIWSDELWLLYGLNPFCCTPSYQEWQNIVHPDDLPATEHIIKKAVQQGVAFSSEWRVKQGDGTERWLMSRGRPFKDAHDRVVRYLGTVIDITESKRVEEEKKLLQTQLIQAQKMEAIGTLAGGIAHDFNNILGAILGYAEMAREESPPQSHIAKDLDQVLEAGRRAADLVKQILAFSRQDATERVPLEPSHVVKEAIKLLRPALPSTITIKLHIDIKAQTILADPTQVHQILMNLSTNAFHAMEKTGGVLEITLQEKNLLPQDLQPYPKVRAGKFIVLSIADTGPGIAREIRDKIFDPYFTTKEVGKGTGLGLAIVNGIVTASGGFVTCDSEPGKGATFHVFFPVIEKKIAAVHEPVDLDLSGNERILLVDDEEILVEMGQVMLERLGYTVTTRTNSLEALVTFKNQPESFDAVITDQTMPGITGSDLSRMLLQIRPDIPIILCTGFSTLINEEQARAFGIKGFAMKPLVRKELAKLLRKVLDR